MKRVSEHQLTKDNADEGETPEAAGVGGFEKAPPEVLATRRILKARRTMTGPAEPPLSAPPNPFTAFSAEPAASATAVAHPPPVGANPFAGLVKPAEVGTIVKPPPGAVISTKPRVSVPTVSGITVAALDGGVMPAEGMRKRIQTEDPEAKLGNEANPDEIMSADKAQPDVSDKILENSAIEAEAGAEKPPEISPVPAEELKHISEPTSSDANPHDGEPRTTDAASNQPKGAELAENNGKNAEEASTSACQIPENGVKASPEQSAVKDIGNGAEKLSGKLVDNVADKLVAKPTDKETNGITEKPAFVFGASSGAATMSFAAAAKSDGAFGFSSSASVPLPASKPTPEKRAEFKEAHIETGEEDDEEQFRGRAKLYSLESDGKDAMCWRERGVGALKFNKNRKSGKARLVMRTEATLRVVLNTAVFKELKFDKATERSLRFQGYDVEGGERKGFLVRFATRDVLDALVVVIEKWKESAEK